MKDRKSIVHCYSIADFHEEEAWLQKQHAKGWALRDISIGCIYHFEKCEPANMVYQLDFCEKDPGDLADYIQMIKDYGWEYLGKHNGWLYVRKPVSSETCENADELFSDNASRLEMIRKVAKKRYLPICLIFLCIVIPNTIKTVDGDFGPFLSALWIVLLLLYVYIILHCFRKFARLKKDLL